MKKIVALVGIFFLINLTACAGEKPTIVEPESHSPEQETTVTAEQSVAENEEGMQEEEPPESAPQELPQKQYEVETELYSVENVKVEYPQIINLENEERQAAINELIKTEALAPFLDIMANLEPNQEYEADATYEIKLNNDKVLSIAYTSYNNIVTSAHPTNMFHTTNIDLTTGKQLTLSDFVPEINLDFINLLKKSKYVGEIGEEYEEQIREQAFDWYESDEKLIEALTSEGPFQIPIYVTEHALGFSMPVAHVAGDHAEFEISLSDLKDMVIFDWD